MDADRFDSILRTLTTSPSRRHALRLLAGSAAATLPLAETRWADAKGGKKGKGKGCPNGKKKCGKKCIAQGSCCTFTDCTGCSNEQACVNGTCQCTPDLIKHNGKCGLFIDCQAYGETCTSSIDCCGNCVFDADTGESRCAKSIYNCITDNDCLSGPCIGFLCPEANKPFFDLCRQ